MFFTGQGVSALSTTGEAGLVYLHTMGDRLILHEGNWDRTEQGNDMPTVPRQRQDKGQGF
jgi:hypothetical protein